MDVSSDELADILDASFLPGTVGTGKTGCDFVLSFGVSALVMSTRAANPHPSRQLWSSHQSSYPRATGKRCVSIRTLLILWKSFGGSGQSDLRH